MGPSVVYFVTHHPIILGAIGVLLLVILVVITEKRGAQDFAWRISAWEADGQGGWQTQPVLTIRGKEFQFGTPQGYIRKLREIEQLFGAADGDAWRLYLEIDRLERAQRDFIRHPSANAPIAAEPVTATANASWTGTPANQGQAVAVPAPALRFIPEVAEVGKVPVANMIKSLYGDNPDGFTYWRDELFKKSPSDACEYAGRVLDAVWAD